MRAIPLAVRSLSRPNSIHDIVPRKDIISVKKLRAKGQLSEIKTVLGWVINTRSLLISLPEHKVSDWLRDIDTIILARKVHFTVLESVMGRLNHVACILNPMRHFMGRLYRALFRAKARSGWTSLSTHASAAGWLRKSNFAEDQDEEIQLSTARKLAALLIDSQCCIYSQWFSGETNNVSDSLSRDFHVCDPSLAAALSAAFSTQVQFGLEIHPLPIEISSWVTSLLLLCPQIMQWSKEPVRSSFARGGDTKTTSCQLDYNMTSSWKGSIEGNALKFSVLSLSQSEKVDLVLSLPNFSKPTRSEPPWTAWHRPTSWLIEPTQDWMQMESLLSFYNDNSGGINQSTQEKKPRSPSPAQC